MPLPWSSPVVRALALLAGVAMSACATPRPPAGEPEPPEVFVDLLPSEAELTVDGVPLGSGPRAVPVPEPNHRYLFRASAPGFTPAERAGQGARLAGTRVGMVLRPAGFAAARPLDLDDGESLAAVAELLQRGGRGHAALEYAERAVEASPRSAPAHRVLGDVSLSVGASARALQAYRAYLLLAPDAADRDDVERRMRDLRGEPAVPGVRVRRGAPGGGGSG
jgi:hypothetical protein